MRKGWVKKRWIVSYRVRWLRKCNLLETLDVYEGRVLRESLVMKKVLLALVAMLSVGAAFSSAVTDAVLSSVRLRPPATAKTAVKGARLLAAAPMDSGCEVVLAFTGEPDVGPIPVTRGTAIEFEFLGDAEIEPLYYVVTEANPQKVTRYETPEGGLYSVAVQSNTRIEVVCRRPIYVDPENRLPTADASTGYYSTNALASIPAALALALDGAEVRVAGGRVYEPFAVTNRALRIVSPDPQNPAVIDGGGTRRCVTITQAYSNELEQVIVAVPATNGLTRVEGFTLTNGSATSDGGGVWGGTVVGCRIQNCRADGTGGGLFGAEARNCLVTGCLAGVDGAGAAQGVLKNCTVTENAVTAGQTAVADASTVYNSIVFGNGSGTQIGAGCATLATFTSGVVFGEGWHLRRNSPGVNGALQDFVEDEYDLEGLPRRDGVKVTAGCFQSVQEGSSVAVGVTVNGTDLSVGGGSGWTYDPATSDLTIDSSGLYTLAGAATGVTVRVAADAGLFFDNLALEVGSAPVLSVADGKTLTIVGGTAELVGSGDIPGQVVFAGGSVNLDGRTFVHAVNLFGKPVHCVEVDLKGKSDGEVEISGLDGYEMRGMRSIDGKLYLWLADGWYLFAVDGRGYEVYLNGDDATAFPRLTIEAVEYLNWNGSEMERGTANATELTADFKVIGNDRWYVVTGAVTATDLAVSGTANLILADGATLTADGGIRVTAGNTLNVYAQSEGDEMGKLIATGVDSAGIGGGYNQNGGTITIYGGDITATGGSTSAGIGGGYCGNGGEIFISGGNVTASGGTQAAGIGGGRCNYGGGRSGTIMISGGTVRATGQSGASDIGNGYLGASDSVTITGGSVIATQDKITPAPTNAENEAVYCVTVEIKDNEIKDKRVEIKGLENYGLNDIYPIDGKVCLWLPDGTYQFSVNGVGCLALVEGGLTTVVSEPGMIPVPYLAWNGLEMVPAQAAAFVLTNGMTEIGSEAGAWYVVTNDVTITNLVVNGTAHLILADGATLTANGGIGISSKESALIVYSQAEGTGALNATGSAGCAGIGGAWSSECGTVEICGGRITARGGPSAAGIGGGSNGAGGTVKIRGGTVSVYAGERNYFGPGEPMAIGSGQGSSGDGTLVITGGSVKYGSGAVPTNGVSQSVYCVTVEIKDKEIKGKRAEIKGLENYGLNDIYPIDGKAYLWLPNGSYTFTAGDQTYVATVNGAATTATEIPVVPYLRWNGTEMVPDGVVNPTVISNSTTEIGSEAGAWYVVTGAVTTTDLKVNGTAHLILADGATLTANGTDGHAGVMVLENDALLVYGQAGGTGSLAATGGNLSAGIGAGYAAGQFHQCGTIVINGGVVTATGNLGAGIGGCFWNASGKRAIMNGGTVTINGGTVTAKGENDSAGIGGGPSGDGGTVTISGGLVTAVGCDRGAGIGGGGDGDGGTVRISGGTVCVSHSGEEPFGLDIGGGSNHESPYYGSDGTVTINGGNVLRTHDRGVQPKNENGEAVFCVTVDVPESSVSGLTSCVIEGLAGYGVRDVQAFDGKLYLWLPNGFHAFAVDGIRYAVTVADGPATAFVGDWIEVDYLDWNGEALVPGKTPAQVLANDTTEIGKDNWYVVTGAVATAALTVSGTANLILADGAKLTANGGIRVTADNTLNVYAQSEGERMGALVANGALNTAGIGGGYNGNCGTIRIAGGSVTATGGKWAAGIGGGYNLGIGYGHGGTVSIFGGVVTAKGGQYGAGIGGGDGGHGGTVTIAGGLITATAGDSASGIGGGNRYYNKGGSAGTIVISGGTVVATGEGDGSDIGRDGASGAADGTVKITGGSVRAVNSVVRGAPKDGGGKPVYCVTVDVPASSVSSLASFTVEGLADYGVSDLYPVDGKLYLWLPNGGSYFHVSDGEVTSAYRCLVENNPTVAVPYGPNEAGLTVNGLSVMYGPRAGWRFDPGTETLVLDGGIDGYTIGGSNVTAAIVASNTVSLTLASVAVGTVAATPDANVRLAFAGRGCRIADSLRLPDAARGALEITGGTAQIVSVEGGDGCTLTVSGGSLDFDCAPDAVPAKDSSGRSLVRTTIVVPEGCPDDQPIQIEGLGSYGVSELYPTKGRLLLWLPDLGELVGRMFFTVNGHYYFLPEVWDSDTEIVGVWTGFAVNGVDISAARGEGWDYDIHRGTLTLDGSVEYELCCTNGVFDYDVKPTAPNGTVTVRGTLDWSDPELALDGAFRIVGGNIVAATRQFNVAPSNGTESVRAVRLTLPEDVDPYAPIELGGFSGYDTHGMVAVNREVCLWLPDGVRAFTVNGARCQADVRGRDTHAEYCETGVAVDGVDCATVTGEGWSWSPVTKNLRLDGAHVLDSLEGTNLADRVVIVGGETAEIRGGTSDLPAEDVCGAVRITGGSHRFEGEFAVPPSNGVARVWRVEALVPWGVAEGDEVDVECPGYDGTGIRARDGRVWLWLPDTPSLFFTINGTLYYVTINGGNVRAEVHETGLCLNGLDIGGGRGPGWTWDYATGKLELSGKADSYAFSRSASVDSAAGSYGDANLALVGITNSTTVVQNGAELFAGAGHAVFTTATGAVTTLRFKRPGNKIVGDMFGDDRKPGLALSGEGEYVIAGGTAEIGRADDGPSVTSRLTINGGSIRIGSEADLRYPPVNGASQKVYRVSLPMPRHADRGRALPISGLPDYYDVSEIYPYEGEVVEETGNLYFWLPTNSYTFVVGGSRFTADVNGDGWVEAVPERSPIGVTVNGVDCSYFNDTGWTWSPVNDTLYLSGECEYLIAGTNDLGWVNLAVTNTARATRILLDDLRITGLSAGRSAIDIAPGAELVLGVVGDLDSYGPVLDGAQGSYNTTVSGGAGIHVPAGAKLTIGGMFSRETDSHEPLTVNGGRLAAGIGGTAGEAMGEVVVTDHRLIIDGGDRGAGIGGGSRGDGGVLTVTGGEIIAFGGFGIDGAGNIDDLGGAGMGGGASGTGGRVTVLGGIVSALGGTGGAVIGGGAGGDGGTLDIRAGTVYPYESVSSLTGASVFGGGSGGEDGVNLFRGGTIAVTHGLVRTAPTNGSQPVTMVAIELPRDLESSSNYRSHFVRVRIEGDLPPGYGTEDIYTLEGHVYLWFPDGTYNFTMEGIAYNVVVANGVVTESHYQATGVTVNGCDVSFAEGLGWTWSPVTGALSLTDNLSYVVTGEAVRSNVWVNASGSARVVLSNFTANASLALPLQAASGRPSFFFAGENDRFASIGGEGTAVIAGGNVVLGSITNTANVVVKGGSVFVEGAFPTNKVSNAEGKSVVPVFLTLPYGCVDDAPVSFEGLPPDYDLTGVRPVEGRICVWLPYGTYAVDATGRDADGNPRSWARELTVYDFGYRLRFIDTLVVQDEDGRDVVIPRSWVDKYRLVGDYASTADYTDAVLQVSSNAGLKVWQSFLAGLDPTNPADAFFAVIEVLPNGKVSVGPNQVREKRVYRIIASEDLEFADTVIYAVGADGRGAIDMSSGYRFFKLKVGLE